MLPGDCGNGFRGLTGNGFRQIKNRRVFRLAEIGRAEQLRQASNLHTLLRRLFQHRLGLRQQIASVCQHHRAERGDPHRFRSTRPVEHGTADGFLQSRDLLTHRRLGVPEPRGRPPERALVGDGLKDAQSRQIHKYSLTKESYLRIGLMRGEDAYCG